MRSTGFKQLGVLEWLSLMVERFLKGKNRWKAVKTSTFKVGIKAGTIFRPYSCVASVGRNTGSVAPLHLLGICLFIYISSLSVLLALPPRELCSAHGGEGKLVQGFSARLNVEGKVYLARFSTHDSLLSLDQVMFVYRFSKHLLTFSFCTKYPLLLQYVVWGLENAFGESC